MATPRLNQLPRRAARPYYVPAPRRDGRHPDQPRSVLACCGWTGRTLVAFSAVPTHYGGASARRKIQGRRRPCSRFIQEGDGRPHLPGVADELECIDRVPLTTASFAHVDGYRLIGKVASRAIRAAKAAGVSLLLNLGGGSSSEVFDAIRGYPRLIVQTSVEKLNTPEAQPPPDTCWTPLGLSCSHDRRSGWAMMVSGRKRLSVPRVRTPCPLRRCGLLG